ncbi:ACP S-malonyltransferase [Parasphingorhabdus sp. DH2-15]|uniref:ACP S-malonyltransferase n=1 Tax=Parasphingorhabdus sp. DH2-15 TaxID=3444112 RepID=UPI003F6867CA
MRAFVFPGQGSQKVGMGQALSQNHDVAKAVFDEVDDALGQKLSNIMFEGPAETLLLTENAQPAIMAVSIATLRVLLTEKGGSLSDYTSFVAGHSLGEYSALCAAGSLDLAATAKLLRLRGAAMQDAVPVGEGAMAALLGLDFDVAEQVAKAAAQDDVCEAANDNAPGQVVISGSKAAVERALPLAKEAGAKKAMPLPVSAPFHCSLMQPAAEKMAEALAQTNIMIPAMPLFANVTAAQTNDADSIRELLVQQVTGRVRWRESVLAMAQAGVTETVELGGKVLGPMIKRITPDITPHSLISTDDILGWCG